MLFVFHRMCTSPTPTNGDRDLQRDPGLLISFFLQFIPKSFHVTFEMFSKRKHVEVLLSDVCQCLEPRLAA